MTVRLEHGDMREVLKRLKEEGARVHAVVCDPPYHLTSIVRRFGGPNATALRGEGALQRGSRGFMGKEWDGGDIAFQVDTWRLCYDLLPPGGHLLAFSATRTYHRMACAIEDAGFEIRDCLAWLYGSGFPKSHDIAKAIDRGFRKDETGQDYKWSPSSQPTADVYAVTEFVRIAREVANRTNREIDKHFGFNGMAGHWTSSGTQPAVPTWPQWEKLKAFLRMSDRMDAEVLRLNGGKGDRSIEGTALAEREVLGTRTGKDAVNGDLYAPGEGTYLRKEFDVTAPLTPAAQVWAGWGTALKPALEPVCLARKPIPGTVAANVLANGTGALNVDACRIGDEVREAAFTKLSGNFRPGDSEAADRRKGTQFDPKTYVGRWPANVLHDGSEEVVRAFPSSGNGGGTREMNRNAKPDRGDGYGMDKGGATTGWSFGDAGSAARFFYSAKAQEDDRLGSKHPTVKPVDLMRWLVRLITPPGGTVLDPFAGSGTTGMACMAEGFDCILVEREPEYAADIRRRIAHVKGEDTPLFAAMPAPGE